jgi:hypothetical protein
VTNLAGEKKVRGMRVPKAAVWVVVVAVAMGLLVGAFLMVAVKKICLSSVVCSSFRLILTVALLQSSLNFELYFQISCI